MRALVCTAPGEAQVRDLPEPRQNPGEAVVRVEAAGICGLDVAGFLGRSADRQPPVILGHEAVGTVVYRPPGDWPWREGDRVVADPLVRCGVCSPCRAERTNLCTDWRMPGTNRIPGVFAEYAALPPDCLMPIAKHVSAADAVAVEPLASAVHAAEFLGRSAPGSLVIYGAGTQGILLLQLLARAGWQNVAVVDAVQERLEIACESGAAVAFLFDDGGPADRILAWSGGNGAVVGIDAAGTSAARMNLLHSIRPGGFALLMGMRDAHTDVDFRDLVARELALQTSFGYTRADFLESVRLVEAGAVRMSPWTKEWPLADGESALTAASTHTCVLKQVLTM